MATGSRFKFVFLAAFLLAIIVGSTAHAQLPFRLGIAAGVSAPAGDLSKVTNSGYNVTLLTETKPPLLPVAFRLEGALNHFAFDGDKVVGVSGGARSLSLNANAILDLPSGLLLQFYGIGGVGVHRITNVVESTTGSFEKESSNKVGFNAGGGVRLPLPGFAGFLEVRYHHVNGANGFNFVPITFGIRI